MSRAVDEWIATHDDQRVPPRVRLRVFERENGICHISGRKIATGEAWELEHKVSLILGGEHRETNLFPALAAPHREKTSAEMQVKSKIAKVRKKHLGITKPAGNIKSPGFVKPAKPERVGKTPLPPRPLYRQETQA
jgi:5-methylcytosine-specific restriction protein A